MLAGLVITCLVLAVGVVIVALRKPGSAESDARVQALALGVARVEQSLREESRNARGETADALKRLADSLIQAQGAVADAQSRQLHVLAAQLASGLGEAAASQDRRLTQMVALQGQQSSDVRNQLEELRGGVETKVEALRAVVDERLREIRQETAAKLEQMRATVDEKLQSTLEKRLGESFRQVSERLEQVYKGLGEMQVLATGVGDLKRVLANVKTRGTWGEVQLANLLEQILARDQYARNVATNPSSGERVEFAIRLPGPNAADPAAMWLPIDAKFPLEDYQALVEACERGDAPGVDEAGRRLEGRIKGCARDISAKYINPPHTTDFALMFMPNEGLYAEVLRRPGLVDVVQREHRIVIAGPMTLWAILNSLQMGFRTLAIQHRSSEVWALLGAVKAEFGKFGGVLDKIQQNLHRAASKIDEARKGTRAIERRLTDVQELPAADASALLDGIVIEAPEPEGALMG